MIRYPVTAPTTAAVALAQALHPERDDHRVGDWGARPWSTMRPEWRASAIASASATLKHLRALGYVIDAGITEST